MHPNQKPIALWLNDVIGRRKISARAWATKAGLGKDTVSRAIRDDYENVTSTRTLLKLAEAAGERPHFYSGSSLPSEDSLTDILETILAVAAPERSIAPDVMRALAGALRDTLGLLANDAAAAADPVQARLVARTTAQLQSAQGVGA